MSTRRSPASSRCLIVSEWTALAVGALFFLAPAAPAAEIDAPLQAVIAQYVQPILEDPQLIAAMKAQNAVTAGYDDAKIGELDSKWQAEIGSTMIPTITPVWDNPVSDALRAQVGMSGGLIKEMFVMDARGLNVAVSHLTSDYWQGDEEKYLETFPRGAGAIHVGAIEFDESTQVYTQQLSLTVSDPQSGEPLGALTLGLDAEMLP